MQDLGISQDRQELRNLLALPSKGARVVLNNSYADIEFALDDGKEIVITQIRVVSVVDVFNSVASLLVEQNDGTMLVIPPSYVLMTVKMTGIL